MGDQRIKESKRLLQLSLYLKIMFEELGQAPTEDEIVNVFVGDVERLGELAHAAILQERENKKII